MKKAAIITLPLNNHNYGGVLQAFALQTFLRSELSAEVLHLNRQYDISNAVRLKAKIHELIHLSAYRNRAHYFSPISRFIKDRISLTSPLFSQSDLLRALKRNDIQTVITGSDQVWRQEYAFNILPDLFLDFPFKGKKLSYAASFGSDNYIEEISIPYLKKLDGVSFREEDAQKKFQSLGIKSHHHIDPTLLLDSSVYSKLADLSEKSYAGSLVVYMLDKSPKTESWIQALAAKEGWTTEMVGQKRNNDLKEFSAKPHPVDSVEDWLKAFRDAAFIVTDSFHGCVFSILFKKPFITVGNKNRGLSRFLSLLSMFSLSQRLASPGTSMHLLDEAISYGEVHKQLEKYRMQAKEYLSQYL